MTTGYSGTPLAKKLSLKDGMRVWWDGMPDSVRAEIAATGLALKQRKTPIGALDAVHIFVSRRDVLDCKLRLLLPLLAPSGFIWVSWPKARRRVSGGQPSTGLASKVDTDIVEDSIREVALPMGLVDVKVCAVDEVWSGLKLMRRRN